MGGLLEQLRSCTWPDSGYRLVKAPEGVGWEGGRKTYPWVLLQLRLQKSLGNVCFEITDACVGLGRDPN